MCPWWTISSHLPSCTWLSTKSYTLIISISWLHFFHKLKEPDNFQPETEPESKVNGYSPSGEIMVLYNCIPSMSPGTSHPHCPARREACGLSTLSSHTSWGIAISKHELRNWLHTCATNMNANSIRIHPEGLKCDRSFYGTILRHNSIMIAGKCALSDVSKNSCKNSRLSKQQELHLHLITNAGN